MPHPHDSGGASKVRQKAGIIRAVMAFAVICLLGSVVSQARANSSVASQARANSLTPGQLQPFEKTYYDTLQKSSPTDAANFLTTRAYVRQAQDVVDHPEHGLDFPTAKPNGFRFAYLIKGDDFLIDEALGQALYMKWAGLTAATLPPHPLLQITMTTDERNKYDALKVSNPKLAQIYSDTRGYVNQCGQVVHYPDRAPNLPQQPVDYTPSYVSNADAHLVRAAVQLHEQVLHSTP